MAEHFAYGLHICPGGQQQRSGGMPQQMQVELHANSFAETPKRIASLALHPLPASPCPKVWVPRHIPLPGLPAVRRLP